MEGRFGHGRGKDESGHSRKRDFIKGLILANGVVISSLPMRARPPTAGGRSIGLLVIAVLVAGVSGSVVSYFLAGLFPFGPVRDFFFKSVAIGVPTLTVNLGFASFTVGLCLSVSTVVVLLVGLAVYLWYKF